MNLNAGYLIYESLHEFKGTYKQIEKQNSVPYLGGGVSFGISLPISQRIWTSSEVGVFQFQRLDRHQKKASQDIDYTVSNAREDHRIYGANFAQSLKYRFFLGSYILEPLIQASLGYGKMNSETNYYYDDLIAAHREEYKGKIKEDVFVTNLGAGINFLTQGGASIAVKVQQNALTIGDRTEKLSYYRGGGSVTNSNRKEKINETRNDTTLSLSAGFVF